tara:strand:- start:541 stop:762 length:222 start_codon:yes stop_codon:yes gene_type:complete
MAVSSIAELKTKIQTLSDNKRGNLRNPTYLSTIADSLQTEIVNLNASGSDASLISQTETYLSKVQTMYSSSIA